MNETCPDMNVATANNVSFCAENRNPDTLRLDKLSNIDARKNDRVAGYLVKVSLQR